MASELLGVRVSIEVIDCNGDLEYVEATLTLTDDVDGEPAVELSLGGDKPTGRIRESVLHEALRLINALPVPLAGEGNGDA